MRPAGFPMWARIALAFAAGAAAMLALYLLFGGGSPESAGSEGAALSRELTWVFAALVVAALVFIAVQFTRAKRRGQSLAQANAAAVMLLRDGKLEEAIVAFEDVLQRAGHGDPLRALAAYNLGHARLRLGRLPDALSALNDAIEHPAAKKDLPFFASVASELALAHATNGDTASANAWLQKVTAKGIAEPPTAWVLAWITLALREGRFREAAEYLDRSWPELERRCAVLDLRLLQSMGAAALEYSGAEDERIRALRERAGVLGPEAAWLTVQLPDITRR